MRKSLRVLGRRNAMPVAVAVVAVAVTALVQGTAGAADPLRVTAPVQATKPDDNPGRLYSTPYLAVDPSNPLHMVATAPDLRTRHCGMLASTNGGQSWRFTDQGPSLPSYPFCETPVFGGFQARAEFGRGGALYYALNGFDTQDGGGRGNISLLLGRSTDLGATWRSTVVYDTRGKQGDATEQARPIGDLAVDTHSGNDDVVYVSWARRMPTLRNTGGNDEPQKPMVAASTDGGRTFGLPVDVSLNVFADANLRSQALGAATTVPGPSTPSAPAKPGTRAAEPNQPANFGGSEVKLAVDDKGTIYAVWSSTVANVDNQPPVGVIVSKSTDKGKTWTSSQVRPFEYANGTFSVTTNVAWSPQGGSNGTLHVVYGGNPHPETQSDGEIDYVRSTDGGKTWSAPKSLADDDPAKLYGKFYPNISVAPNGRVDVAWWDTRDDPGIRGNDVYYASSSDSGKTWSKNIRVTDTTIDRRIGVWAYNFDMSSPPAIASTNAYAALAWDDTRNTDTRIPDNTATGGGLQDIYTSSVQYTAVGGAANNTAKAILAGFVGLLVVGLVLLGVALAGRRRGGANTSSDDTLSRRTGAGV